MLNPKFFFACLFFLLSLSESSEAQMNLVPNPSFEIHDTCPDNIFQIHRATGWKSANGSPDYHHVCANWWTVSVPFNFRGFQPTISDFDSAYAGIYVHKTQHPSREILSIDLSQELIIGRRYYASLIMAATYLSPTSCHCNKMGIRFISYKIPHNINGYSTGTLINNFAHIYTDSIVSDTSSWFLLEGSFVADSAYSGILVGNFFTPNNVNCFCRDSTSLLSYYFIDRICVSENPLYCPDFSTSVRISSLPDNYEINLIGSSIHIRNLGLYENTKILMFDISGRLLLERELKPVNDLVDISHVSRGIYILRIKNQVYKFIY